jgi:uncharacterized phage protein (TIGR01671 family)
MREIEFKVWDKKYNIFDDDLWIDCDGTIWDRPARGYDTPHTEIEPLNQDNYIICFYTGLCDKNGKKIFEGDVVKHHRVCEAPDNYYTGEPAYNSMEYIRIGHITIRPSCGITINGTCETRDYNEDVFIRKVKYSGNPGCWYEYAEILGNKFQHPELLEQ